MLVIDKGIKLYPLPVVLSTSTIVEKDILSALPAAVAGVKEANPSVKAVPFLFNCIFTASASAAPSAVALTVTW